VLLLSSQCTTQSFVKNQIFAMTSHRDAEVSATTDERAPLLADEAARGEETSPDVPVEPQKNASKTWQYVWRGFGVLFAILVIAVFVKGWIDSDDDGVSFGFLDVCYAI
jgi:hypothetical protein